MHTDDSDDNHSMVTVCPNNTDDILILNPTDPADYMNANVDIDGHFPLSNLQTIVEVVNPMLSGDGTAQEIPIANIDDENFSFDDDQELSLNDKMKNVLKELKENEKVRLSLSRSMDEEEDEDSVSTSYEEKTGSIGTVFMVRERLINDFYDHQPTDEHQDNQENIDNCQVYSNPSVDEFLAHEIRHTQSTLPTDDVASRKEALTLDLTTTTTIESHSNNNEDEEEDDDDTNTDNTPSTPTKSLPGGKKKRRKSKNKAKK